MACSVLQPTRHALSIPVVIMHYVLAEKICLLFKMSNAHIPLTVAHVNAKSIQVYLFICTEVFSENYILFRNITCICEITNWLVSKQEHLHCHLKQSISAHYEL